MSSFEIKDNEFLNVLPDMKNDKRLNSPYVVAHMNI